jgi:hypothetical protein
MHFTVAADVGALLKFRSVCCTLCEVFFINPDCFCGRIYVAGYPAVLLIADVMRQLKALI